MKINFGADEIILWLRKNGKQSEVENFPLGRKIAELMKDLDAEFTNENEPVIWDFSNSAKKLPQTSQQYKIDVEKLPELFKTLESWD